MLIAIRLEHNLRNGGLQDLKTAPGAVHSAESGAGAHHRAGAHHCGTHHAGASCKQQSRSIVTLPGEWVAEMYERGDIVGVYDVKIRLRAFYGIVVEINVQQFPFPHCLMVFLEEERQPWKLKCKGEISMHHIAEINLAVPFRRTVRRACRSIPRMPPTR